MVKCLLPPSNSLEDMASINVHEVISPTTYGSCHGNHLGSYRNDLLILYSLSDCPPIEAISVGLYINKSHGI